MKDQLSVDLNPDTGSVFYRIGEHPGLGLNMGFRLWKEVISGKQGVVFGFRLRITSMEGAVQPINMKMYCAQHFPSISWSGGSVSHTSVSGAMALPVSQYDVQGILAIVEKENLSVTMWDKITSEFPGFTFLVNHAHFAQLLREIITDDFCISPEQAVKAPVLNFSQFHGASVAPPAQETAVKESPKIEEGPHKAKGKAIAKLASADEDPVSL